MQVFLSYSDADRDFARELASQLSKRGCEVWDPSDQLFPGDNWPLKTGEALKESKAMVVLLSPDSMKSEWVRGEIQYALGNRNYEGRVFSVLVRPTADIPWILRKFGILRANKDPEAISRHIATALGKGAELSRARAGKRVATGMTIAQLRDSTRKTAKHKVATPVNWKQGGDARRRGAGLSSCST